MGQKLGQHFLINKLQVEKIINALNLEKNDCLIEIGPGTGALTKNFPIQELGLKVIGLERDSALAEKISQDLKGEVEIILGDALETLPEATKKISTDYKIIGNIPYYITGHLFRVIGELEHKPTTVVLMIQKEVAERVLAKKEKMSLLSASVHFWAEPEIISYLKPGDFNPPPKVDSAVIRLRVKKSAYSQKQEEAYYRFIKIAFKQPRKTLLNNLTNGTGISKDEVLKKMSQVNLPPNARAQDLTLEKIIFLSESF